MSSSSPSFFTHQDPYGRQLTEDELDAVIMNQPTPASSTTSSLHPPSAANSKCSPLSGPTTQRLQPPLPLLSPTAPVSEGGVPPTRLHLSSSSFCVPDSEVAAILTPKESKKINSNGSSILSPTAMFWSLAGASHSEPPTPQSVLVSGGGLPTFSPNNKQPFHQHTTQQANTNQSFVLSPDGSTTTAPQQPPSLWKGSFSQPLQQQHQQQPATSSFCGGGGSLILNHNNNTASSTTLTSPFTHSLTTPPQHCLSSVSAQQQQSPNQRAAATHSSTQHHHHHQYTSSSSWMKNTQHPGLKLLHEARKAQQQLAQRKVMQQL